MRNLLNCISFGIALLLGGCAPAPLQRTEPAYYPASRPTPFVAETADKCTRPRGWEEGTEWAKGTPNPDRVQERRDFRAEQTNRSYEHSGVTCTFRLEAGSESSAHQSSKSPLPKKEKQ